MAVPDSSVNKQDAIAALAELRLARRLIESLQSRAIERWAESANPIAYTDAELDNYRAARDHLLKSLRLNPFNPQTHWLLANACGEIDGDLERTLALYSSSLELDPGDDDVLVARMGLYLNAGRFDDAERDLQGLQDLASSHVGPMATHLAQAKSESES